MQTTSRERRLWRALLCGAVCALLLFIAFFAVANDRYAFFGSAQEVTLTLHGGETPRQVAQELRRAGVVRFARLYARSLEKRVGAQTPLRAGEYVLSRNLPYRTISDRLLHAGESQVVRLTFPEGETVYQTVDRLVAAGIGTRERYLEVIATYPFDFAFLPPIDSARAVRLEGYLYPDTYEFYQNSTEEAVIARFLANFERKFDAEYRARCEASGYSVDEVITLASLIQAEGKGVSEYGAISSVFHNRLRHWHGARLESDATVRYAISLTEGARPVTAQDLYLDSPYNTYLYAGLPPSPVCNPSKEAIAYALCPKKTSYYYFVAGADGYARFATTYREHLRNVERAKGG